MLVIKTDNDFTVSVEKALKEIDKKWQEYPGLIVVGSHAPSKVEEKIDAIKKARETGTPTLGICFGMQLMAVEYARNVLRIQDATSEEIGKGTYIVKKLPELRVGGIRVDGRIESHWHNYAFNNDGLPAFREKGWNFLLEDKIVEVMRLEGHPFFVGTQFHAEYQSSRENPHPILKEFLLACKEKK